MFRRPGRATRRPSGKMGDLLLGSSWGYVGPFFEFFSHFGIFLDASYAILVFWDAFFRFFSIFCPFWMDFGKILGWFFDGFSYFCPKLRFCKNRCFFKRTSLLLRFWASANPFKIDAKTHSKKHIEKRLSKINVDLHFGFRKIPRIT